MLCLTLKFFRLRWFVTFYRPIVCTSFSGQNHFCKKKKTFAAIWFDLKNVPTANWTYHVVGYASFFLYRGQSPRIFDYSTYVCSTQEPLSSLPSHCRTSKPIPTSVT
jgi:hypothetical protein